MRLDESLFDEYKEENVDSKDALTNMVDKAIQSEWSAVDEYHSMIVTLDDLKVDDAIMDIFDDLITDNHARIGQLESILGQCTDYTDAIDKGRQEGEEALEDAGSGEDVDSEEVEEHLDEEYTTDDGWDDTNENMEYLCDTLEKCHNLYSEIKQCVRGVYSKCYTYTELANYIKSLASALEDCAGEIEYLDESTDDEDVEDTEA